MKRTKGVKVNVVTCRAVLLFVVRVKSQTGVYSADPLVNSVSFFNFTHSTAERPMEDSGKEHGHGNGILSMSLRLQFL